MDAKMSKRGSKMKRIIALFLAMVMCLSIVACGNTDTNDTSENKDSETTDKSESSPDTSELEEKYNLIVPHINSLKDSIPVTIFINSESVTLTKEYVYNQLKELGDYKDSKEYLARFVIFTDKLLNITKVETDSFGQKDESVYKTFSYNESGTCIEELQESFKRLGCGIYPHEDFFKIEYDANGVITGALIYDRIYQQHTKLENKVKFEYDTNGNIIKANFQNYSGKSWTNEFSYDDKNHLIEANIVAYLDSVGFLDDGYYIKYEYNSHGNVIKETKTKKYLDSDYIIEYAYNENGLLSKKFSSTATEVYFYDEDNRISHVEVYDANNVMTYTLKYNYGVYYIFK